MPKSNWNQIVISPLSGPLDTRSKPAELAPGSLRYKLNLAINRTGALSVSPGYEALDFGLRSDDPTLSTNWDFHYRNQITREPVTFLFEATDTSGKH